MSKRLGLLIGILGIVQLLSAQVQLPNKTDKQLKLTINSGISITNYWEKQAFFSRLCTEGCFPGAQNPQSAFVFDANFAYPFLTRQHFGLGFTHYSMSFEEIGRSSIGGGGLYEFEREVKYQFNSLYLLHQWQLNQHPTRFIYWNNSLGLDIKKDNNQGYLIKKWLPFYRTGLSLEQQVQGGINLILQPYTQMGIGGYTKKVFGEQVLMKPITFGLMAGIKLNFKNRKS